MMAWSKQGLSLHFALFFTRREEKKLGQKFLTIKISLT